MATMRWLMAQFVTSHQPSELDVSAARPIVVVSSVKLPEPELSQRLFGGAALSQRLFTGCKAAL